MASNTQTQAHQGHTRNLLGVQDEVKLYRFCTIGQGEYMEGIGDARRLRTLMLARGLPRHMSDA